MVFLAFLSLRVIWGGVGKGVSIGDFGLEGVVFEYGVSGVGVTASGCWSMPGRGCGGSWCFVVWGEWCCLGWCGCGDGVGWFLQLVLRGRDGGG